MKIAIQRMPHCEDLPLPAYATAGAAGLDLLAAVGTEITLDNEAATNPHLKEDAQKAGSGYGLLEWPALLRSLDRQDPSYRD